MLFSRLLQHFRKKWHAFSLSVCVKFKWYIRLMNKTVQMASSQPLDHYVVCDAKSCRCLVLLSLMMHICKTVPRLLQGVLLRENSL